jgi:hypothetical protein
MKEIINLPTVVNNTHESVYRSYHILRKVLEMIERGDSKETIFEFVEFANSYIYEKQT